MSPAMTRPLSRTRSRMSTRPCDRDRVYELRQSVAPEFGVRAGALPQPAQRSEIDVEIFVRQTEDRLQLVHPLIQLEQRHSEPFDFLVASACRRPSVEPPDAPALRVAVLSRSSTSRASPCSTRSGSALMRSGSARAMACSAAAAAHRPSPPLRSEIRAPTLIRSCSVRQIHAVRAARVRPRGRRNCTARAGR